jgi:Cu/Ag efflux pump CusA
MTLGGLAAVLGVVVDDAIITVENILRRLRENLTLTPPRPLFNVVLDATLEVRNSVVYATFVVAMVFVPVLTMSGLQGVFFRRSALRSSSPIWRRCSSRSRSRPRFASRCFRGPSRMKNRFICAN